MHDRDMPQGVVASPSSSHRQQQEKGQHKDGNRQRFCIAYIPADVSAPIEERWIEVSSEREVEDYLDVLKRHFESRNPIEKRHVKEAKSRLIEQIRKELPNGMPESYVEMASSQQLVETLPLLRQTKANGCVGVHMYVDDLGKVKGLERNVRATEIAKCCGILVEVLGDAFISRVRDDGEDYERLDFRLGEVSSRAVWVKEAIQDNTRRNTGGYEVYKDASKQKDNTVKMDVGGKMVLGGQGMMKEKEDEKRELAEGKLAEVEKKKGNQLYAKGMYEDALECYGRALKMDPSMISARNNRAMAYLKLERWGDAREDALLVLEQEHSNAKAVMRAATAEAHMGLVEDAKHRLMQFLEKCPDHVEARERLGAL